MLPMRQWVLIAADLPGRLRAEKERKRAHS
jgi:hypothetical protein